MYLFWHRMKEGETSDKLLEQALLAYCTEIGKRKPRKKNRVIARGEHGKPYYPVLASVFPSVSHSGEYWVSLFDRHPCGVDIEAVTRNRNGGAVIRRRFTPEEQALFPEYTEEGPGTEKDGRPAEKDGTDLLFLKVWTRKEAYLKYTGEGLTRDLRSFSVAETLPGGKTVFREKMVPYYGEETVTLRELDFSETGLPLVGAVSGIPGEIRILPLPEKSDEETFDEAKEIALDYIEARERTEWEVRKKLAEKGVLPDACEEVLHFLREYGFIDDSAYARRYVEYAAEKGRGPLRIRQELAKKGISPEKIRDALAAFQAEEAERRAAGTEENGVLSGRDSDDSMHREPNGGTENGFPGQCGEERDCFRENAMEIARKTFEQSNASQLDDKLSSKILRRLASRGYTAGDSYGALEELRRELRNRDR